MISEPGAKTLAWPRGRRGGSAGEGGRGGRGGGGSTLFYSGVLGGLDSPRGTKFYALNRKMTKQIKFKKIWSKKIKNVEHLGKKTRGNDIP